MHIERTLRIEIVTKLKTYYLEHRKELRIITILIVWIIQGLILNHYFVETNNGKNDSETDAVILLTATAMLFLSSVCMFILTFYLEKITLWRLIYSVTILLIPIIWMILIFKTGNPLYFYAK